MFGFHRDAPVSGVAPQALLGCLVCVLAACARISPPVAPEEPTGPPAAPADARTYRILPGESELQVLVYRDGPLASLGHNHVISAAELSGEVLLGADPNAAIVRIVMPVSRLEVDRPELRQAAGPEFPGELDDAAISGTRENMLGDDLLKAADYPEVRLVSRRITGVAPELVFEMDAYVRDQVARVEIPATVALAVDSVTAHGAIRIAQTDLGLKPYSVMLGALAVRDELDIRFRIVARSTD